MKVVVVGGTGHLGSRAVGSLRRLPGMEVVIASRRGPTKLDLADPTTFGVLADADVVVDLADATTTAPDALAAYCLEHGPVLVEATSDREAVERIHRTLAGREGKGAVVLGAGIFTGLSNLLAASVAREGARSLQLAIRSSPYSGAGTGTIALMIAALRQGARSFVDGRETLGPAVARGPRFPFPSGEAPSLLVSLAEPWMIHHATRVPTVHAYLAPQPSWLVPMFLFLPRWLLAMAFFRAILRGYFTLLRRWLLRSVSTRVEMVVRCDERVRTLVADDGMGAGGAAIAAIVACLPAPVCGMKMVDELMTLDQVVAKMKGLPAGGVTIG